MIYWGGDSVSIGVAAGLLAPGAPALHLRSFIKGFKIDGPDCHASKNENVRKYEVIVKK